MEQPINPAATNLNPIEINLEVRRILQILTDNGIEAYSLSYSEDYQNLAVLNALIDIANLNNIEV